jgi:hypothetical protein
MDVIRQFSFRSFLFILLSVQKKTVSKITTTKTLELDKIHSLHHFLFLGS